MRASSLGLGLGLLAVNFLAVSVYLSARPSQSTVLFYDNSGLSWPEKQAMRKSKELAKEAAKSKSKSGGIVDGFMKAYKHTGVKVESFLDYTLYPTLQRNGLLKDKQGTAVLHSRSQQLKAAKVVMTDCVKCVSECPAYLKKPFKADDFDQFQTMAMDQCPTCFHGVMGPCPANKDNHGVLRAKNLKGSTQLHTVPKVKASRSKHTGVEAKAAKQPWSSMMGTNVAFLGDAN